MDPVECEFCHGLFCLKHRLESDHQCPNAVHVTIADQHQKNRELAKQKLAEMKKKMHKK